MHYSSTTVNVSTKQSDDSESVWIGTSGIRDNLIDNAIIL